MLCPKTNISMSQRQITNSVKVNVTEHLNMPSVMPITYRMKCEYVGVYIQLDFKIYKFSAAATITKYRLFKIREDTLIFSFRRKR